MALSLKRRRQSGASLIEVLVVIVIFLVGILALLQTFPIGFGVIANTRNITTGENLARAEMERIQAQDGLLPEMIVPVDYVWTMSGVIITVNPNRLTAELMPDQGPVNGGEIDNTGQVLIDTNPIGNWQLVSGANLFNRVIGEGQPVPGPRRIPGMPAGMDFGSLMSLRFAPIYDDGTNAVLTVYGNDMNRQYGNRARGWPSPWRAREGEFYYVDDSVTDGENFTGEDQLWIAPAGLRSYRITFSFNYDDGGGQTGQYEVIIPVTLDPGAPPAWARIATDEGNPTNYWVISLPQLLSQPDVYGQVKYTTAGYRGTDPWSVRVQRIYQRIAPATAFSNDPYEYKIVSTNTGQILINPRAATTQVRTNRGRQTLYARADYTVFDWRIIQDEFRVPDGGPLARKLIMQSLQPASSDGPDNRPYSGLQLGTPDVNANIGNQDFVLFDVETGGVILGNENNDPNAPGYPQIPNSAYRVDKTRGTIEFRDVDDTNPDLSAYIVYPTGDTVTPWTAPVLVDDISGRNVRALYRARGNWSVQPFKAASNYRVVYSIGANGLAPGETFVGGTNGVGVNSRLYFTPADLGQQVVVSEIWYRDAGGNLLSLQDTEFQINAIQPGLNLAYIDITNKVPGATFDSSLGYIARGVRGASMKVRVLWNTANFSLQGTPAQNFDSLEEWMRSYRRIETQSFALRGTER